MQGGPGSLLTSDGEIAAAESLLSPSESLGRTGGERWKQGRDRSLGEAKADGGSSCGSSASSARKPGSEEEQGATGEGGAIPAESGSLFELRDALRSREKELLRLKRDVSVVATSAGGFKHLAASLGSSDTNNAGGGRSFAFDHRGGGGGAADGDRSGFTSGPPSASYLFSGSEGLAGAEGASGAGSRLLVPRRSVESSLAETSASHPTTATSALPPTADSPRRMMPPPPPRRRQRQQQQPSTAVSAGAAPVAVSGSPLVASAHEGLRQMRAVLEQRAREAERAKDDSNNMVSWGSCSTPPHDAIKAHCLPYGTAIFVPHVGVTSEADLPLLFLPVLPIQRFSTFISASSLLPPYPFSRTPRHGHIPEKSRRPPA